MPFSSQASVFSTLQQEISFSLATRLEDYILAYDTNVPISANRGRLEITVENGQFIMK